MKEATAILHKSKRKAAKKVMPYNKVKQFWTDLFYNLIKYSQLSAHG